MGVAGPWTCPKCRFVCKYNPMECEQCEARNPVNTPPAHTIYQQTPPTAMSGAVAPHAYTESQ